MQISLDAQRYYNRKSFKISWTVVTKVEVTNLEVTKALFLLEFATKLNFSYLNLPTINQNTEDTIFAVKPMPELMKKISI